MIWAAPWMRAPCTALNPSGPHPSTTTSEPASTRAFVIVAARPTMPTSASTDSSTDDTGLTTGTQ